MRFNYLKTSLKTAVLVTTVLLLGAGLAVAQQQVNLTAGPTSLITPDGATVPMWGYTCGTGVATSTATCAKANPNPTATGWSPVVITVPTGQDLQINLTNSLMFANSNSVPTSLVIVGQLGGGLGSIKQSTAPQNFTPAPDHSNAQELTWPFADPTTKGTPPHQADRLQSFATQVAAGATTSLTWTAPRAGTYLIESGTHPSIQGPMGLYGILVVTDATTRTAYPGVTYGADIPLLLSEIDPIQNKTVDAAVNTASFSETAVWSGLPNQCGNKSSANYLTCYPPAVNYTPLYYLFNGVALDKSHSGFSLFPVSPATGAAGDVLVRFVNAGLRMHVPAIVGGQTGSPAVSGFGLIAEDGNPLPGVTRVQSEVFMAPGKTYDVKINVPAGGSALPVFDRELSLSGNATARDAGMLAYISINGATLPTAAAFTSAVARDDTYNSVIGGQTFTVSDPGKGVMANDTNVSGVQLLAIPIGGTVKLNGNGTFTYTANSGTTSDSFTYCANGSVAGTTCSSGLTATVTLGGAPIEGAAGISLSNKSYTSNVATFLSIKSPGILLGDKDGAGYPLTVKASSVAQVGSGWTLSVDKSGAFNAVVPGPGTYQFSYKAQNSQGTQSASTATVTLNFPTGNGPHVTVLDGQDKSTDLSGDYRWIIEEDRTFYIDPTKTTNSGGTTIVPTFGTNFHTSYMPLVAQGCVGTLSCESGQTLLGQPAVCDIGDGACRTSAAQQTAVDPSQVHLDPTKRYYLSILPGDGADALAGDAALGHAHGMGGAPLAPGQANVTVYVQPTPFPTSKLSVFVFEDDFPLNGEQDAGGGIDILASNEPGLGGFEITLFDDAGGTGDATGQMTYDMFNQPLSNSLAGTIDPATGNDACPISAISRIGVDPNDSTKADLTQTGITGTIVTCPRFEAGGTVLSPLAGQAVIANLMPGRYGVVATPAADRIARGEEWLQTNTLDGEKAHDSFLRVGEPSFFQEFGPAGYHVSIGFANPIVINSRLAGVCSGSDPIITGANCHNTLTGTVTTERMSRTPDERLYSSGSNDSFAFTQCYVSFGDPDGEDFAFTKCAADGSFSLSGLPDGTWRVTVFDQWNDMLVDGLSTPVGLSGGAAHATTDMGQIAMNQWQANIYTRTFFDQNGDGVSQDSEPGLSLVPTNIRFRDGSFSNFNNTDLTGAAGFNEIFPLFSWYVVETTTTRYKSTGNHVVYDAGGPADGTCTTSTAPCGASTIGQNMANTAEQVPLPPALRVPGAVYCDNADCAGFSIATGPEVGGSSGATGSTGRIDPPWVQTEGWQGFSGQNSFIEFGKMPFAEHENGGIQGHVVYASTRPFDDPALLLQLSWEPLIPHVTVNLYHESTAPDGSQSLKLVDTTQTSSFDDWAQGFRSDGNPNMSCPGQFDQTGDLFFFSLFQQPMYLDVYNSQHGGPAPTPLPNNAQYKCYDGMHNWNQVQPAPYDGMYQFPSVTSINAATGKPAGTNCHISTASEPWGCVPNPDTTDPYRSGAPMLADGKYVVEVVVPPGYELVKEEDKNILIGDTYIAPVTVQFPGVGGTIYILPDQAAVDATFNANNAQNSTTDLGATPRHEGDTGSVESFWPCVGQARIVPDFISLFPGSAEVSPFAGATRNLCDRKEVTLDDQTTALAKFYLFTSTHVAAHFTGVITDDFTSEFDPFSPQFGEKFSPPNLPISIKDWSGTEISRVYTDQWGTYNGLTYSTWEVNPPNPTGYAPQMMVTCMNDPGTGATPDPLFNPEYSQFCYEIPFMPGQTQYMDTPVVPTSAFAGAGYNNPDCAYPNATPAISEVDGDAIGPWVSAANTAGHPHTLTIRALPDQTVPNNAYSGPSATTAPFNGKTVTRHYGFGGTQGTVTIGGISAAITGWGDTQITVNVPTGVPSCAVQQQAQYGGSDARCGELVITTAAGKQSIDTVTVTIGGKAPTHVLSGSTIQSAIDAAAPGDLIIVNPGTYNELLLMWKPVRLQGVGAASSVINANAHPAGKLDVWRQHVNCLFGLAINGQPYTSGTGTNPYDSTGASGCPATGWNYFTGGPNNPQVDRSPKEGIVGWDTTVNGNLAELLQEPSLMGAYEGAGITVLAKGVKIPAGTDPFGVQPEGTNPTEAAFPDGTTALTVGDCTSGAGGSNLYSSSFHCNPSRIDGLGITDSSQGGGGIFVHAWGHNLEIANNRVYNNSGTMSGGISVGQGETTDAYLQGDAGNANPGSCMIDNGITANTQLPFCYDTHVNVHHNAVTRNSSTGDELFSSTPAGAGGVTLCSGADYYKFNYNWVCGNMSTGDGGGLAHLGFIYNGDIEHNAILFNQSTNPTIPTNGGGIVVMSTAPDGFVGGTECGSVTDVDCAPGLGDGTGPGLIINANLIMGNGADSGSGGGIRLQSVNGTEVVLFPTTPQHWNSVSVTNNIIANNVAGWDGAGVSLQDALNVDIINNTIMSNDSTASSGVLFNTLGAPLASSQGPTCTANCGTTSAPQPAGLVAVQNSSNLTAALPATITCPEGHGPGGTGSNGRTNGACRRFSYPLLANDVFWENRSFYIGVGSLGSGTQNQQNVVALYNAFTTARAASEPSTDTTANNGSGVIITGGTGACVNGASYWDIGVRGDTGPTDHSGSTSATPLAPMASILTSTAGYAGTTSNPNLASDPTVLSQYCNGSRTPPEFMSMGYQVPAGISDATVPNPIFSLTPAATVDEGNNWINISWGPLAATNAVTGATLGNYALAAGSPAIDQIPFSTSAYQQAPTFDFFGTRRKGAGTVTPIDIGAVEFTGANTAPTLSTIVPNMGARGYSVPVTLTGTNLTGTTLVNVSGAGITVSGITVVTDTTVTATFAISTTATPSARTVSVTTPNGTSNTVAFMVVNPPTPTLTSISPMSGMRGSSVPVTLTGTNLLTATAVNVSGNGFTITGVTAVNDTTVTANFAISATATLSNRNVSVTTLGGTSNTVQFTVTGPTLTSIAPTSGARGTNVPVTITGTGLTGAVAINAGGGITASGISVNTGGTQITASFAISASAGLTTRNVTVTTPNGTTPVNTAVQFTVTGPTLTSIAPTSGARGSSVPVTLTGTNLTGATAISAGGGITASGISVNTGGTQITASFAISATTGLTTRNVTVTTPNGTTPVNTAVQFTVVNPPAPTLASVTPNTGVRGTSVPVTLIGTNFTATGTTVAVPGGGVTVSGVSVNASGTQMTATFTITNGATLSARNVSVTTPGGNSTLTGAFTVQGATLASIAPTSGLHNTTVAVTLTGTNFPTTGTTTVAVSGGGVAASAVHVVNSTTITANFAITNGAAHTARNVTVATPIGTTNAATFTVN